MSIEVEVNGEAVTIDDETVKKFDALPNRTKLIRWTPEMDAILLKWWKVKQRRAVAAIFDCSETSCQRRYEELTKNG